MGCFVPDSIRHPRPSPKGKADNCHNWQSYAPLSSTAHFSSVERLFVPGCPHCHGVE